MAEFFCVYREVAVLGAADATTSDGDLPPPTCRRSPRFMRPSHATMNTNVMAH